jgi:hypothetical protein
MTKPYNSDKMAQPDYNFLNTYVDRIINRSNQVDDQPKEDDDTFFSTSDDESADEEGNDGISYSIADDSDFGFHQANDELHGDGDPIDENGNPLNDNGDTQTNEMIFGPGGMTEDQEGPIHGNGSTGSFYDGLLHGTNPYPTNFGGGSRLSSQIAEKEGSRYDQVNTKGGGAGAVGKYQFRWNLWKDSIQKVTGVKNRTEFAHSPAAQEKYYNWYEQHVLIPQTKEIQPYNARRLSQDQLAKLIHYRGIKGAKDYLQGNLADKPEDYNMSISKYIGSRQAGGAVVASTPSSQYHGLNNGSFSSMVFPMEGENTFRGLDDGTPVYLEDETGNKKILKGRHHKTKMKGHVFETRLNK